MTRANMNMQMKNKMKKKKKKKNNTMTAMSGAYGAAGGGSLKMVTNDKGQRVPFFAADGKGKMMAGGKVKKMMGGGMTMPKKKMMGGGKVKKYRGGGITSTGLRPVKMIKMTGSD